MPAHGVGLCGFVENTIAGYAIVYTVMDEGELVRIAVDSMFRRQWGCRLSFGYSDSGRARSWNSACGIWKSGKVMTRHKGCTGAEDFQKMESEGDFMKIPGRTRS